MGRKWRWARGRDGEGRASMGGWAPSEGGWNGRSGGEVVWVERGVCRASGFAVYQEGWEKGYERRISVAFEGVLTLPSRAWRERQRPEARGISARWKRILQQPLHRRDGRMRGIGGAHHRRCGIRPARGKRWRPKKKGTGLCAGPRWERRCEHRDAMGGWVRSGR